MAISNRHRRWLRHVQQSAKAAARPLLEKSGVVSVTIGEKRRAGVRSGQRALVVYVNRKGQVGPGHLIPPVVRIDGPKGPENLVTDVVQIGTIPRLLTGVRAGELILCTDNEYGTSCLAFNKDNVGYVATCAHVISNLATGEVFLSYLQDPATLQSLQLGGVAYVSSIKTSVPSTEDFALIQTRNLVVDDYCILGESARIGSFGHFTDDLTAEYWYSSRGLRMRCAHPEPTVAGTTVHMNDHGVSFPYTDFFWLQALNGIVAPGHSGSLICRGESPNIVACGIVFAGADPSYVCAFPIQPMFDTIYDTLP